MEEPLVEQLAYYRARADEYDEWFLREGRYDRGEEATARWFAEVRTVEATLAAAAPYGDCLELACGTGLWTRHLLPHATRLLAVDGSPEMLARCRARLAGNGPHGTDLAFCEADLFAWTPPRRFDFIFFSFWLSHVPPERFDDFWVMIGRALQPAGRVFFLDSLPSENSIAVDHFLPPPGEPTLLRKLNDGRQFRIYKINHEPSALEERLAALGFASSVQKTGEFFLFGQVRRSGDID